LSEGLFLQIGWAFVLPSGEIYRDELIWDAYLLAHDYDNARVLGINISYGVGDSDACTEILTMDK
jgi:hypothetical protein